jgi:hypothetical protein
VEQAEREVRETMTEYIDKTRMMKKIHTGMTILDAMREIIDAPAAKRSGKSGRSSARSAGTE